MGNAFPAPKVPLGPDNALDLDQLGSNHLITHVKFPGIDQQMGGIIYIYWWGCTEQGEAIDFNGDRWPIDNTLEPEGLPIQIANDKVVALRQGWVFYSYVFLPPGSSTPLPESKRLFFYVGKRPSLISQLPVPQISQSHDLALDPDRAAIPAEGVTVSIPPYAAMAKGDKVTLQWRGFESDDTPRPLNPFWDVQDADVGRPLEKLVARNQVILIEDGRLELRYHIAYAAGGEDSLSAQQNLRIVAPVLQRLPALTIDDYTGGALNPDRFPNGVTLRIELYAGAQVGEVATLYATIGTETEASACIRLDPSTFDSGVLTLHLDHAWLVARDGKRPVLRYQFARAGSIMSGEPLELSVRRPLRLPHAIILDVIQETGEEPNEGAILAADTATTGSRASVPAEAIVGDADTIHLHWGEPGTPGHSVVTTPIAGDRRAFDIPKSAIAMNMGAGVGERPRLKVFYRVIPAGEPEENFQDSDPYFLLKIVPFPIDRFPTIQCELGQGTDGILYLSRISDPQGAEYTLRAWSYIEEDQILNIKVSGKDHYLLKDHRVTKAEADAEHISSWLLKSYLETEIGIGNTFKVSVTVSFDEGRTHTSFKDSTVLTLMD
jgi:hypothetical protein